MELHDHDPADCETCAANASTMLAAGEVAEILETSPRTGAPTDDPEGSRFVMISDTLASALAVRLRGGVAVWKGSAVGPSDPGMSLVGG